MVVFGKRTLTQRPEIWDHIPDLPLSSWASLATRPSVFLDCNFITGKVSRGEAWTLDLYVLLLGGLTNSPWL